MSDREIRTLEQAVQADPSDRIAMDGLQRLYVRSGRGWAGETLPTGLTPWRGSPGVYGLSWWRGQQTTQFVRVPAKRPFYVGRFPITNSEYFVAGHTRDDADHPVVGVSFETATEWCLQNAPMRLPTRREFIYLSLVDWSTPCPRCRGTTLHAPTKSTCTTCEGSGRKVRRFPWGDDARFPAARCVWGLMHERVPSDIREPRGTRPVSQVGPGGDWELARPDGASRCGAHDTYGHVWQMTTCRRATGPGVGMGMPNIRAMGGAFDPDAPPTLISANGLAVDEYEARPNLGFRVVLDSVP